MTDTMSPIPLIVTETIYLPASIRIHRSGGVCALEIYAELPEGEQTHRVPLTAEQALEISEMWR